MRILVTGASGLLGSTLMAELSLRHYEGVALDRNAFLTADLTQQLSMLSGFDVIIHAAANTNVEQCEIEPEKCYYDNCFLTTRLYECARQNRVKFVCISSTGIYGRHKTTPYHEYDIVSPTTVHHRSKYIAEQTVLASAETLVARIGWLFGGPLGNKKNFVANRLNEIRAAHGAIYANTSQVGTPTSAQDCAQWLLQLIAEGCSGLYNIVNQGSASRYAYVKHIAALAQSPFEVLPTDASSFKRYADVSENEAALSYRLKFEGRPLLRPWQEALADYMENQGLLGCLASST